MPNDSVLTEFKILLGRIEINRGWKKMMLENIKLTYLLQHLKNTY